MRMVAAVFVVFIIGGILAAGLLIGNRTLAPGQYETITTACPQCHGRVPAYDVALTVHYKHAAFNCSRCHSDISGLQFTDSFRIDFKWAGMGILSIALIAIIANFIIVNGKGKAN